MLGLSPLGVNALGQAGAAAAVVVAAPARVAANTVLSGAGVDLALAGQITTQQPITVNDQLTGG